MIALSVIGVILGLLVTGTLFLYWREIENGIGRIICSVFGIGFIATACLVILEVLL